MAVKGLGELDRQYDGMSTKKSPQMHSNKTSMLLTFPLQRFQITNWDPSR